MEMPSPQALLRPRFTNGLLSVVAAVVIIISVMSMISALVNLKDPVHVVRFDTTSQNYSLASFEGYKLDVLRNNGNGSDKLIIDAYIPTDTDLHTAYDAAVANHKAGVRLDAFKDITTSCIEIFIAGLLVMARVVVKTREN